MRVKALYHQDADVRPGEVVHAVDVDGGGFVVSSEIVGIAVQNFLNNATVTDMNVLHAHLLDAFANARNKYRTDADVKRDMVEAHDEGWHAEFPREFCPECGDE